MPYSIAQDGSIDVGPGSAAWAAASPAAAGVNHRLIYVDPVGGNDGNSGLATNAAVATMAAAYALWREGSADWILIKRGTTVSVPGALGYRRGHSAAYPCGIGAYGTGAAPVLQFNDTSGFTWVVGNGEEELRFCGLRGIDIRIINTTANPESGGGEKRVGVGMIGRGQHLFLDDVLIEGGNLPIDMTRTISVSPSLYYTAFVDCVLNRVRAVNPCGANRVCFLGGGTWRLLMRRCVFGMERTHWAKGHSLSHAVYLGGNSGGEIGHKGTIARESVFFGGGLTGLIMGGGGTVIDCTVIETACGIECGRGDPGVLDPTIIERTAILETRPNIKAFGDPGVEPSAAGHTGRGIYGLGTPALTVRDSLIMRATDNPRAVGVLADYQTEVTLERVVIRGWESELDLTGQHDNQGLVVTKAVVQRLTVTACRFSCAWAPIYMVDSGTAITARLNTYRHGNASLAILQRTGDNGTLGALNTTQWRSRSGETATIQAGPSMAEYGGEDHRDLLGEFARELGLLPSAAALIRALIRGRLASVPGYGEVHGGVISARVRTLETLPAPLPLGAPAAELDFGVIVGYEVDGGAANAARAGIGPTPFNDPYGFAMHEYGSAGSPTFRAHPRLVAKGVRTVLHLWTFGQQPNGNVYYNAGPLPAGHPQAGQPVNITPLSEGRHAEIVGNRDYLARFADAWLDVTPVVPLQYNYQGPAAADRFAGISTDDPYVAEMSRLSRLLEEDFVCVTLGWIPMYDVGTQIDASVETPHKALVRRRTRRGRPVAHEVYPSKLPDLDYWTTGGARAVEVSAIARWQDNPGSLAEYSLANMSTQHHKGTMLARGVRASVLLTNNDTTAAQRVLLTQWWGSLGYSVRATPYQITESEFDQILAAFAALKANLSPAPVASSDIVDASPAAGRPATNRLAGITRRLTPRVSPVSRAGGVNSTTATANINAAASDASAAGQVPAVLETPAIADRVSGDAVDTIRPGWISRYAAAKTQNAAVQLCRALDDMVVTTDDGHWTAAQVTPALGDAPDPDADHADEVAWMRLSRTSDWARVDYPGTMDRMTVRAHWPLGATETQIIELIQHKVRRGRMAVFGSRPVDVLLPIYEPDGRAMSGVRRRTLMRAIRSAGATPILWSPWDLSIGADTLLALDDEASNYTGADLTLELRLAGRAFTATGITLAGNTGAQVASIVSARLVAAGVSPAVTVTYEPVGQDYLGLRFRPAVPAGSVPAGVVMEITGGTFLGLGSETITIGPRQGQSADAQSWRRYVRGATRFGDQAARKLMLV